MSTVDKNEFSACAYLGYGLDMTTLTPLDIESVGFVHLMDGHILNPAALIIGHAVRQTRPSNPAIRSG